MEKPRPGSFEFHHQPACGSDAACGKLNPLGTKGNFSIGVVPRGQLSGACVVSEKVTVIFPATGPTLGATHAPVRVWPPEKVVSCVVNAGPIMAAGPTPYHVERPDTSYMYAAMKTLSPCFSMV